MLAIPARGEMRRCGIWFAWRRWRARPRCRCWRFGLRNGAFLFLFPAGPGAGWGGNQPWQPAVRAGRWRWRRSGRSELSSMAIRAVGRMDYVAARSPAVDRIFMHGDGAEVRIGDVSTPLTCGVLRPLILLPANARDWDAPAIARRAVARIGARAPARLPGEVCCARIASVVVVESAGLDARSAPESRAGAGLR